jgi:hypothetical protein
VAESPPLAGPAFGFTYAMGLVRAEVGSHQARRRQAGGGGPPGPSVGRRRATCTFRRAGSSRDLWDCPEDPEPSDPQPGKSLAYGTLPARGQNRSFSQTNLPGITHREGLWTPRPLIYMLRGIIKTNSGGTHER